MSSIRGRRHVMTLQIDKLPMDIERLITSDDDDDFDIIMTDFVSIAKKAALVPPKKSCLKKTGAPSRNVRVSFEGQKKAWVPKSLLRKKAEAKQKALEASKKEAEIPSTPAVSKRGKEEAPCSISMDSSGDVSSPFAESITSGQSPPRPVPATKRVQILVRASSIDSAESIGPKVYDCAEETCESPAGGDSSSLQQQPGVQARLSPACLPSKKVKPVLTVSNSYQLDRDSLMKVLKTMGIFEFVSHMLSPGYKSTMMQTDTRTHPGRSAGYKYVDFSLYVASEEYTKCAVDKIVDYELADQLCGLEDNVENLKDYASNIL